MNRIPPTWGDTLKSGLGCVMFIGSVALIVVALYLVAPVLQAWADFVHCYILLLFGGNCMVDLPPGLIDACPDGMVQAEDGSCVPASFYESV